MRVGFNLVVGAGRSSGAKEYLFSLIRQLVTLDGCEEYVLYFAREARERDLDSFTGAGGRVECVRTEIPMFPTPVRVVRGQGYWRRRLRRDRVDVFHHTYFPLPAGVEHEARVVITLHDLIQRGMPEAYTGPRRWFTNLVQPSSLRRADIVAVVSNAVAADVAKFHPEIDPRKVEVVPNGIGEQYLNWKPDPRLRAEVRRRYELPERYVLGVGHLEPRKNWVRLIRAYARVLDRLGNAAPRLVIVGAENWRFRAIYEAAAHGAVANAVTFTGFVDEEHMTELYAGAELFAYPSLYEGFGIPVLEAMACGVPVVTSAVTSLPEVAGGAACLVDPYDIESIASGLERTIRDQDYRRELIGRGFNNVERYSWRASALRLREIYRDLARQQPVSGEATA